MIYARVHDRTVAEDYYAAMDQIEERLELVPAEAETTVEAVNNDERAQLLELVAQMAAPELGLEGRLELVAQMRRVLNGGEPSQKENQARGCGRRQRAPCSRSLTRGRKGGTHPRRADTAPLGSYHYPSLRIPLFPSI